MSALEKLGLMFYVVDRNSTTFETPEEVPKFINEVGMNYWCNRHPHPRNIRIVLKTSICICIGNSLHPSHMPPLPPHPDTAKSPLHTHPHSSLLQPLLPDAKSPTQSHWRTGCCHFDMLVMCLCLFCNSLYLFVLHDYNISIIML